MSSDKMRNMLADTLGCNVYQMPNGDVRGCTEQKFKISEYWQVQNDVTFCVDEDGTELLSALIRIRKNLWAYMVLLDKGNRWMLFFDNDRAKIQVGREREFCTGTAADALRKLRESAVGAQEYLGAPAHKWRAIGVPELLNGI